MPTIEHNKRRYRVDEKYFLINHYTWDRNWVDYRRVVNGFLEIGEERWKIIISLRDHYKKNETIPTIGKLSTITKIPLRRIFELFPDYLSEAAVMSGLPGPFC